MNLANTVKSGKVEPIMIDDVEIDLDSNNLLVTMQGKEGFAFAGEGEIGVVLDTKITPELREEGDVREVLSKVQNLRKDKGFEVTDKIILYVNGNEVVENLCKKYEEKIKAETLAKEVRYNVTRDTYTEVSINGKNVNVDAEVVKELV